MTITRSTSALLALAGAALALLIGAGTAAGGGFSTTTLDPLAGQPRAGETTEVGYTIRTHGVTPVAVDGTGIAIVDADGRRTVFPGRPDGPVGHYVAEVRFPAAGSWTWAQVQGDFTAQELGAVEVAPADASAAAAAAPRAAEPADDGPGAASWALLAATIATAALLAVVALRPGRPRAAERVGRRAAIAALAVAVAGLATATALTWGGGGGDAPPPATHANAAAGAALDGAALFSAKGCAVCHMAPGRTEGGTIGPDLRSLARAGAEPEYVRESILAPEAFVVAGWSPMPRLEVSDAEADALAGYLLGVSAPTR
jgi:cytochrome c551/c552